MKRWSAFVLLCMLALGGVVPLWATHTAQAQTAPVDSKGIPIFKEVWRDEDGEVANMFKDTYTVNPKQIITSTPKATETTASFSIELTINPAYEGAIDKKDGAGVGILSPDDSFGGWGSILLKNNTLYDFKGDNDTGIYLEIKESSQDTKITQGGPFYNISKLIQKVNTAFPQLAIKELKREAFSPTAGEFNIAPFFLFLSDGSIFGKEQTKWSTKIVLTDLKPETQYYARVLLRGVNTSDTTRTEFITFKTSPKGTGDDPKAEEIQEGLGESTGSAGGNVSIDMFGEKIQCELTSPTTWPGCFAYGYYVTGYYITYWAVRGAAGLMDIFMAYSLGSFIYKNSFIDTGWTVVRDVCNILFIFILLWTAFKMVINDHHFKAQEVIVNIIVVGLLINFSLFFSKAIIDMGNISARVFYNQIRIEGTAQDELTSNISTNSDLAPKAISEALANGLDLTVMTGKGFEKLQNEQGYIAIGTIYLILFLGTIINIAAAWIFIKVSFAFLGRILSLWMAMIFSPFAFTSTIIGGGHGSGGGPLDMKRIGWSEWLKGILEASFYPALFLFFVFLILLLIRDDFVGKLINEKGLAATPFLIVTLFKIAFIIGLLKVSGDFAKKMAGSFGGELTAAAGKLAAFAGGAAIGLATGGAAFVGRNTLGRAASMVGTEERIAGLQDTAAKGGISGYFARQSLRAIDGTKKASFDVRQTGIANKISAKTGMNMDALGRAPGLGFLSTTGSAGGIEGVRERKMAKMQARADSLGENKKKKKEIEDEIENRKEQIENKEEEVVRAKAALAQDKATGGADQVLLTKTVLDAEKELRDLKKSGRWTTEDAGSPGGPGGVPPAIPPKKKADGSNVTLADVGKKRDLPKDKMGLDDLEKALKNNSKALAREYMSTQIRRTSPNEIGDDKKDAFGNITEFGHAHGVASTNHILRSILRNMTSNTAAGAALGALTFNPIGVGIGATVGALRGINESIQYSAGLSKMLASYAERNTNEAIHEADHATQPSDGKGNHGHGPKYKSSYKGPTMNIFAGLFSGGGGGDSGHDDHGGGHDDHGGGHH